MKKTKTLAVGLLILAGAGVAWAEHHEAAAPSGFLADFMVDFDRMAGKVVSLAEAVPAEKYSWSPSSEVRNVAAAYVHVAQSNHQILQALGVEPPAGVGEMEANLTDKDEVVEALEESFAAVKEAVMGLSAADLDEQVSFFGREWSKRQVVMLISGHCHEHLGQSIAYARSVGVVPPWSQPRDEG